MKGNIFIRDFVTVSEAVREMGVNSKNIRDAASGKQRHACGFIWEHNDK